MSPPWWYINLRYSPPLRGPKLGQKFFNVKSADFNGGRVTFLCDHAKTADFNGFNAKIPYLGPPHAYLTSWDPLWWKKKSKWAHMSKHEQAWARMLNSLILTGLTSKSPILVLQMLIGHHETLFGDKKERVSSHAQAWVKMLNPLILTGLRQNPLSKSF